MTLLLTSGLHWYQQRLLKKNTNYFYAARISISLAILCEISFKFVTFLRVMQENRSGCFFFSEYCAVMEFTVS